jgi:hypothetical protein
MKWQRMYDAGVAKRNGTEEEKASYREMIARWDEGDFSVHRRC